MELAVVLLRVVVGLTLAMHGSQKLFGFFGGSGPAGTQKFFSGLGFRTPLVMAVVAGLSELGGGLLFALGLMTPLAALALAVVMLNAIGSVHWKKGYFNSRGGYEYNLLIIATALAVTAAGPGRFSLDQAVGWAETISGPRWALGIAALAPLIAVLTLTLGRGAPNTTDDLRAEAKAPASTRGPKEQQWTSV
jgi:putative oxidoreductase